MKTSSFILVEENLMGSRLTMDTTTDWLIAVYYRLMLKILIEILLNLKFEYRTTIFLKYKLKSTFSES